MKTKDKKIHVVQYTIFVYEEDVNDLTNTIHQVLNESSDLEYVCSIQRWS